MIFGAACDEEEIGDRKADSVGFFQMGVKPKTDLR